MEFTELKEFYESETSEDLAKKLDGYLEEMGKCLDDLKKNSEEISNYAVKCTLICNVCEEKGYFKNTKLNEYKIRVSNNLEKLAIKKLEEEGRLKQN